MRRGPFPHLLACSLVSLAWLTACGAARGGGAPASAPPASLYDRLGGQDAIHAVVEDFLGNVAADARINAYFVNADIPRLQQLLEAQLCAATGGGCTYAGKDMKTAHAGMHVTAAAFDALVEDLVTSLDKFKVGAAEQHELLTALGGMKTDIVEPATP